MKFAIKKATKRSRKVAVKVEPSFIKQLMEV